MRLFGKRLFLFISMGLLLAWALTGCNLYKMPEEAVQTSEPPVNSISDTQEDVYKKPGDGKFTMNFDSSVSLNPLQCSDTVNMPLTNLIFEGLFKVDGKFNYSPVLCRKWNTGDGISYTFQIKSQVQFHDGTELALSDVLYSLNLARESELYSGRLKSIETAYTAGDTLYISLTGPNMKFPALLDFPIMKHGTGSRGVPPGTGPYIYVETSEYKCLEAFDGYRDRELLPLDRFYLQEYSVDDLIWAFESQSVDLVITNKNEMGYLNFSEDFEKREIDTTEMHFIGFNEYSEFCASATRRLIISSIIDREYLTANVMTASSPAVLPFSPASGYYLQDIADETLIKKDDIKSYMINAFVEDYDGDGILEFIRGNDVKDFTLDFIVNKDNLKKVAAARHIADCLGEYGFDVSLRLLGWNEFKYALDNGIFDIYYGEVKLTADFNLSELLSTDGENNFGIYDTELDNLINDFNKARNKEKSARALLTYIASNTHIAPLYFEKKLVFTHRGVISNMQPTQNNIFSNITEWKIDIDKNEAMY